MTLQTLLAVASFALSIGGLVRISIRSETTKGVSIVVIISALVLLSSIELYQTYQHHQHLNTVSQDILAALGQEVMTLDQLYETLHYEELSIVTEAVDDLVGEHNVGQKILELKDVFGSSFRVRGYYVN